MLGKIRREKVRKNVFYIRKDIVTKKWGKKREKQFFHKHTNSASKKCWGKNRRKKVRKTFFIFARISCQKMGVKNARNNSCRNKRILQAKNVGEKIVEKSAKKRFLNSQGYRDKEMVGKKRAKQFFQELANIARKKCWEKIVGKKGKKAIFIFARIS